MGSTEFDAKMGSTLNFYNNSSPRFLSEKNPLCIKIAKEKRRSKNDTLAEPNNRKYNIHKAM